MIFILRIRRKNQLKKEELDREKITKDNEVPIPVVSVEKIIQEAEEKKPVVENVEETKEKAMKLQATMQKYRSEG